jgi:uncharacterized protein YcbK (DUF882 family)
VAPVIDRRQLLFGLGASSALLTPAWAEANTPSSDWLPPNWRERGFPTRRWVSAVFVNTGEKFNNIYCENGLYIQPVVKEFSWICRDFRLNQWKYLHPMLMDLLFVLHWKYNRNQINITSGYRTPETNLKLEGTALNSQHVLGMALDIHLQDVDNTIVAKDFKEIFKGGVGMYPLKHFTHLDCGPLRNWVG